MCIPLAVETFGHWGKGAQHVFSCLASLLSIHQGRPKSVALFDIYSRMIHVFSLVSIQGHHGQGSSSLGHLCVV